MAHTRSEFLGRWFEASRARLGYAYDQWFVPAVEDVADAVIGERDLDDAVVRLGADRARTGTPAGDVLADGSVLLDLLTAFPHAAREPIDEHRFTAALMVGFDMVGAAAVPDAVGGFGGPAGLEQALADLARRHRLAGTHPGDSHVLLVVETDLQFLDAGQRGAALHALAQQLRAAFPFVTEIACLADTRFAILAHRHPGLAVTVESFESGLAAHPDLVDARLGVWLAPLPSRPHEVGAFVDRLVRTPSRTWTVAHATGRGTLATAGLVPLLETTPRAVAPIKHRARRYSWTGLRAAWEGGVRMVAAAIGVLVLAGGLARAAGPADRDPGVPFGAFFAAPSFAPESPVPGVVAVQHAPGRPEVGTVPPPPAPIEPPPAPPIRRPAPSAPPAPAPPASGADTQVAAPAPAPEPPPAATPAPADMSILDAAEDVRSEKDRKRAEKEREKDRKRAEKERKRAEDDRDDDDDEGDD